MRIIAGQFKNKPLKIPKNLSVRPTRSIVKKGIFDVLASYQEAQDTVLDLYAGSGSLGIEALSRGAKDITFVEIDPNCLKILKTNIDCLNLGHGQNVQVLRKDVFLAIEYYYNKCLFDLILLDPPYYRDLAKKCLLYLDEYAILHHRGIIVAEHHKNDILPQALQHIAQFKQKFYGDTVVSFYKYNA